jgi:hypothetical protein
VLIGWATIAISLITVLFLPEAGIAQNDSSGAWRGMFSHKNQMGVVMAYLMGAGFCAWGGSQLKRLGMSLYYGLSLLLIIMSQSRTATVGRAFGKRSGQSCGGGRFLGLDIKRFGLAYRMK